MPGKDRKEGFFVEHRVIALVLVLCILLAFTPVPALAEGVTEPSYEAAQPSTEVTEPSAEVTEPSTEATVPSTEATEPSTEATEPSTEAIQPSTEPAASENPGGTCGSSVSWEFDPTTGTLVITGSGAMAAGGYPGWMDYRGSVQHLVIGEGVTSISNSAFLGMGNLVTANLPGSLRVIGEYAFNGCYNMQMPYLNNNITTIDSFAFQDCSSFTELTIPAGVTKIGYGAFSGCAQLSRVVFHNGVTELGDYAFSGCFALTSITIPNSVVSIGASAFNNCINLKNVTLGNSVSAITNHMFGGCTNLMTIKIPDSVTRIDTYAFSGCSQLWDVTLGAGVLEVASSAFNECRSLSAFKVSAENPYLSADRGVLYNKGKTEMLLMPPGFSGFYSVCSGVRKIKEYACDGCIGLTGLSIPGSVSEIGKAAFRSCTGLVSVKLGYGVSVIGGEAFQNTSLSAVYFPGSISVIEYFAFGSCGNLKKLTFAGDMPRFSSTAFFSVSGVGYYPGGNTTWDGVKDVFADTYVNQTFIEWAPASCDGKHTPEIDAGIDATCTEDGLSEGSHCSACGEVIKKQKVIPAAHSYGQWEVITAATEQTEGLAERSCTKCEAVEQKKLDKLDSGKVTAPETTDPGQEGSKAPEAAESSTPAAETEEAGNPPGEVSTAQTAAPEETETDGTQTDGNGEKASGAFPYVTVAGVVALVLLGGFLAAVGLQRYREKRRNRET